MHEASIAQGIIDAAEEEQQKRGLERIRVIGVRIGKLSDVVPEALRFAFHELIKDTDMQDATLAIEHVPIAARCKSCDNMFTIDDEIFVCPKCSSTNIHLQRGEELEISYIDT